MKAYMKNIMLAFWISGVYRKPRRNYTQVKKFNSEPMSLDRHFNNKQLLLETFFIKYCVYKMYKLRKQATLLHNQLISVFHLLN